MRAGTLRTLVEFQRPTLAPDAIGQRIPSWTRHAVRVGSLIQQTGREIEGAAMLTVYPWELRVRYESALANVTTAWRVLADGRTFDVESVVNQNSRNRVLVLSLVEVI